MSKTKAGRLVIIGGAEERDGKSEVLREFVRLAGGARARVRIISVASDAPLRPVLEEFGAQPVEVIEGLEAAVEPLAATVAASAAHAVDDAAHAAERADVRRRKVSRERQGYIWR